MSRKLWISAVCGALALSACSQAGEDHESSNRVETASPGGASSEAAVANDAAADIAPAARSASGSIQTETPPQISANASPRVAFEHNYLFGLPSKNISAVQEEHSRQCAELGLTQCEIIDMDYRLSSDGDVEASTRFILAPRVAGMFGTSAISTVSKAEGKLIEGDMRGEDAGGEIAQLKSADVERMRQLRELERRRDNSKANSRERAHIEEEISQLNRDNAESKQSQDLAQAKLNWTPVTLHYQSQSGIFGASSGDGLSGTGTASLNAMLSFVAIIAPWALLVGLVVWLWRRFGGAARNPTPSTPTETPQN